MDAIQIYLNTTELSVAYAMASDVAKALMHNTLTLRHIEIAQRAMELRNLHGDENDMTWLGVIAGANYKEVPESKLDSFLNEIKELALNEVNHGNST